MFKTGAEFTCLACTPLTGQPRQQTLFCIAVVFLSWVQWTQWISELHALLFYPSADVGVHCYESVVVNPWPGTDHKGGGPTIEIPLPVHFYSASTF